jgi:hypothetical protein
MLSNLSLQFLKTSLVILTIFACYDATLVDSLFVAILAIDELLDKVL